MNQKKEDLSVHQQEDGDNQTRIGALSDAGSRVQFEVGLNCSSPTNCNCEGN